MAWARFLDSEGRSLERHAMYLTAFHVHEAQDLLQMTVERLLRRGWSPQSVEHPAAYAKKTMENTFLSKQARMSSQRELPARLDPEDIVSKTGGKESTFVAPDTADRVADQDLIVRALRRLSRQRRLIIVLRFGEDLTYSQIAERLGCAVSTARAEATRALKQMTGPDETRRSPGEAAL